jgi:hypothetical protein
MKPQRGLFVSSEAFVFLPLWNKIFAKGIEKIDSDAEMRGNSQESAGISRALKGQGWVSQG